MTITDKKLIIPKVVYIFLVIFFITGLLFELYFVLERRSQGPLIEKFKKEGSRLYSAQVLIESNAKSLWEVPLKKYRANATLDKTINDERYIIKMNSRGFRTGEAELPKPAGVYRIICIGGSTTVQGKTNEDTYPALLEKRLRSRYPEMKIEVLNFGISGTFSDHWLGDPEELFKYQPDLIIQYNAVNDICWRYLSWRNNSCMNKPVYLLRRALNLSFLLQKLFPQDAALFDNCFMETLQNFKKISLEARDRGVEYIVGSFAAPDYERASEPFRAYLDFIVQRPWGRPMNLKHYSSYNALLRRYNALFLPYVSRNNIQAVFVDKAIKDPSLFVDICHMTPEGIGKLADVFFEGVVKVIEKRSSEKVTTGSLI